MEAVTVALPPAAMVPDIADKVTQFCPFEADQLIVVPPVF
jgi:hypothetical protein